MPSDRAMNARYVQTHYVRRFLLKHARPTTLRALLVDMTENAADPDDIAVVEQVLTANQGA